MPTEPVVNRVPEGPNQLLVKRKALTLYIPTADGFSLNLGAIFYEEMLHDASNP